MKSKTAFHCSMKMVERLDRSREHFLTLLQLRARSAGLAIANCLTAATVTSHLGVAVSGSVPFPVGSFRVVMGTSGGRKAGVGGKAT